MNAPRPYFPFAIKPVLGLAAVCGAAAMAGCISNPFAAHPVDPASPVAAEVAQRSRTPSPFPTFASIPNPPKDLRPAPQYGQSATRVVAAGDALIRETEPGTWTLSGTDEFAEKARRDAGPALEPATPGQSEADARALRERATPPPPRAPR